MPDTGPKRYTEASMQRMRDEIARVRASKYLVTDDTLQQENEQLLAACDATAKKHRQALAEIVMLRRQVAYLESELVRLGVGNSPSPGACT